MYHRKLNAEESLQEILLRMKYDSKKTLSENAGISEQNRGTGAYALAPQDISPITNQSSQPFLVDCSKVSGVPAVTVSITPEQQKLFADASGLNPNAPGNQIFFCDATKMNKKIAELATDKAKKVSSQIQKIVGGTANTNSQNSPAASSSNPTPPSDLKDVKNFQDWLDKNKGEWAWSPRQQKNYKVEQNPKRGYGRFGPSTQKMWNDPKVKEEYLKSLQGEDKTPISSFEQGEEVFGSTYDDFINDK